MAEYGSLIAFNRFDEEVIDKAEQVVCEKDLSKILDFIE
jgi:hypothetical protein